MINYDIYIIYIFNANGVKTRVLHVLLMKRRYGEEMRPQEDMEVFIDRLIEGNNFSI